MTAILPDSGRAAIAAAMKPNAFLIAVGRGLVAWDTVPEAVPNDIAALTDAIAWHRSRAVEYDTPDVDGIWATPGGGTWTVSPDPTRHLMLRFKLDFADLTGETLREAAVYLGTTVNGGVPGGQFLIDPVDITDTGTLFLADRFAAITRNGSVEHTFLYVHSF